MRSGFFYISLLVTILLCACQGQRSSTTKVDKPFNIVLIVADDLGWSDLSCYGNRFIETPFLDAMAREGMRFTNAYAAAPLCSPSRASIITGHNPARINMTEHLHGYAPPPPSQKLAPPRIITGLPGELTTIAEAVKKANYATGHFGKWHLGLGASAPAANGFDVVYGGGVEGLPKTFFYPFFNGQPYKDLLADTKEGDYLDDALTSKATSFMQSNKEKRFFVELNFYAPHVPIEGKPELVKKYEEKRVRTGYAGLPENEYAAMVENIDYNVGRVIRFLKKQGLSENTMVLFTSDNGGLDVREVPAFAKHTPPTTNAPLRGGKGSIYEGGIREPWIVWMPATIKKGRVEDAVVSTDDIFNTVMALTGRNDASPDGTSFLPLMQNRKRGDRTYFLHFPHYSPQRGKPGAVIRKGPYKLIEWYEDGKLQLFHLKSDPGETNDLAAKEPKLVAEMKRELDAWRQTVNARMPAPNPAYRE